jgi:hypothetical protein
MRLRAWAASRENGVVLSFMAAGLTFFLFNQGLPTRICPGVLTLPE